MYGWNNRKFENEYLERLERNWNRWKGRDKKIWDEEKGSFRSRNLEKKVISELQSLDLTFFLIFLYFSVSFLFLIVIKKRHMTMAI